MKKLLILVLACAYGSSIHTMEPEPDEKMPRLIAHKEPDLSQAFERCKLLIQTRQEPTNFLSKLSDRQRAQLYALASDRYEIDKKRVETSILAAAMTTVDYIKVWGAPIRDTELLIPEAEIECDLMKSSEILSGMHYDMFGTVMQQPTDT